MHPYENGPDGMTKKKVITTEKRVLCGRKAAVSTAGGARRNS